MGRQGDGRGVVPFANAQKDAGAKVDLPNFSNLASELRPSVVYVVVSGKEESTPKGVPKDHPRIPPDLRKGVGSGFVIDRDGSILTNNHVVDEAKKVEVAVAGGGRHSARVIGRDPQLDVALIKIEPSADNLRPMKLGDSDKAKTGQWVMALGNPFGLENNLTVGVISGKGRELPEAPFVEFLQTDAAIYPGNSGGPLVNLEGEAIGINTAVMPGTQLGFSIPINRVKEILPRLRQGGLVSRGFIGIRMAPVSQLPEPAATAKGVLVAKVNAGGPAQAAGIKRNDVIIEYAGKKVATPSDLAKMVDKSNPGEQVTVKVKRDRRELSFELTVARTPG